MKKTYMKPEVNEIEVAANQAVAACYIKRSGYENSWQEKGNGKFGWPTEQMAWEAYNQHQSYTFTNSPSEAAANNSPYVYPVYYGEGVDSNGNPCSGTFHDKNWNGIMDNGEYVADQQGDYNAIAGILSAGVANINS